MTINRTHLAGLGIAIEQVEDATDMTELFYCLKDLIAQAQAAPEAEPVAFVQVTGSLDEIDAPVWPFINAEAQKVGAEHGRIETYKYEHANGGVAVLWDANRIHAMAVTIRDDMNRTRCIRMLTAPPATADAVSVPRELLESLLERYDSHAMVRATMSRVEELRALLAQGETK